MFVRGKNFSGVVICKARGKDSKFFIKKENSIYYYNSEWKKVTPSKDQLKSIDYYRFSSYFNKSFVPFKERFLDFIESSFTPEQE